MTATIVTESHDSMIKVNNKNDIRIKAMIQLGVCLLILMLGLFPNLVTYSDEKMSVSLAGFRIISALFFGNKFAYMQYGKVVEIAVPWALSLIVFVTIIGTIALTCMILFFMMKQKKDSSIIGYCFLVFGGFLSFMYLLLLISPIQAISATGEKVTFYKIYELSVMVLFCGVLALFSGFIQLKLRLSRIPRVKRFWIFYIMLVIPTIFIFVFCLYPILLQLILSFKEYKLDGGIWGSSWCCFKNFAELFQISMLQVIWNTIYISFLRLLAGIIPSIIFAIVLYDMGATKYRKVVQTIVYIPHFFSWVIIYAIVTAFLTPSGIVNNVLVNIFGFEPINFLANPNLFYTNMIVTSIWKEIGWGTILYLAALGSIDKTLYEAAAIDGSGVFGKLWHITLPGMIPIIVFQTIMAVGNLLKGAGGEQILLFATSSVKENKALVIDTWLYWQGLGELKYGLSSAISFMQAVIGFIMVLGSHQLSKKLVGVGAW